MQFFSATAPSDRRQTGGLPRCVLKDAPWLIAAALWLPVQAAPAAAAAAEPTPHELVSARCVAALDAQADALAEQIKAGRPELRPLLLVRLKAGGAFVGDAYLKGERDEARARELLHAAQQAQKALSKTELVARQNSCAAEGARMLAEANPLSRAVVSRLAQRRMKKLLEG